MRLVCPSCAAEYEIADTAIGPRGRMVRCASCSAEWFQAPVAAAEAAPAVAPEPAPAAAPDPAPEPEPIAAQPEPTVAPQPQPAVEPAIEADPEPVVSIPPSTPAADTSLAALSALREGLKDPPPEDPPFRMEEREDERPDAERIQFDEAPGVVEGDVVIEESPADERQAEAARLAASLRETEAESASGGGGAFLAGFATVTLLSLVAIAAYVKAPDIAEVLPAAAGPLASYADAVDQGRLAIAAFIRG